ncbi:MAG: alpha-L-fucosidase [Bacteroidetes bacterium]|nr:alpha-L-fucosidase [Bacteroidota bacterium]
MKKSFLFILLIPLFSFSQEVPDAQRMQWFRDARLGIFIHWGIYAVNGIDESWSFFNGYIDYQDYMRQLEGFTAMNYDPHQWAKAIKESGAKYVVLTSKHHDGVALWPTSYSELNVVNKTPAGKDLIAPFVMEVREQGLKVGLYYSLLDWSHPDYPNFTRNEKRYEDDSTRWESFVKFNFGQITEIQKNYNPDLYWFDGDWEQSAEKWHALEIRKMILSRNPAAIINSRLQGYGDYATPEQGVPIKRPQAEYWELCMTMNDSWGYQHNDSNYKTPGQIIQIFTDCISMGGNLLLDIGPKADGSIPVEQMNILEELGRWTHKHADAIYGTQAGIAKDYYYGPSALSADSNILYLFLDGRPSGPVPVKGIKNKVNRIWVVGNGTKLSWDIKMKQYWSEVPGILYIDVPQEVLDPQITVIAVLLDGEIDIYE